jgi:RNA polymerase sporulation-specific sigma factor
MSNKVVITGVNTSLLPKLSSKEQVELMLKIKNGDTNARETFAVANMRLVLSVVQRFMGRKESVDDIFQVGCVGLMKAIDNFDTNLNVKFSTYAVPMIVGEIKRFLRDNNSIRVSRSLRDIAYRALKAREELTKEKSVEPTIAEIATRLDVELKDVAVALEAISDPLSLYDPVYNEGDDSIYLMDQISDSKHSEDNWLEKINLKDALEKLNEREKQIVLMRYYVGKTQMEVSEEIGISQAQVSRLEKNAIDEIKKNF